MAARLDDAAAAWSALPLQFLPAKPNLAMLVMQCCAEESRLHKAAPTRLQFKFSRSNNLTATSSPVLLHLAFHTCSDKLQV